jgi:2-polyprenyl-3-methyl-5-hydroxy-6-metoxy-1,4-benzoquinol methylase
MHPTEADQAQFWDEWNAKNRHLQLMEPFMGRQMDVAVGWVNALPMLMMSHRRILEIGCGTGWLASRLQEFGDVTAMDLSPEAIEVAKARDPRVKFLAGNFATMSFEGPFSYVVSADVIAHVEDQQAFVDKVADLMSPGGIFVLMTQNPFVWNRTSSLNAKGSGQIRNWPSRSQLLKLLKPAFNIRHQSSIVPQGDKGILKLANSYKVNKIMGGLLGEKWVALKERCFLGRELVIVGERK